MNAANRSWLSSGPKATEYHASRAGAVVLEAGVPFPISDPTEIVNAVVFPTWSARKAFVSRPNWPEHAKAAPAAFKIAGGTSPAI